MKGEVHFVADSYVYYCSCCGRVLFGPQDITDQDRVCPNCGELADLTDLTEEKWNSMSLKSREWQLALWRNQTEYDASIVEQYDEAGNSDEYYSPVYVEKEEEDILGEYYSEVRDWETNPPEEDGEYIIWFIRRDKDPSSRKLVYHGGFWLDAKGEEINIGKYNPSLWMKLPTFSNEVIEYYRNR